MTSPRLVTAIGLAFGLAAAPALGAAHKDKFQGNGKGVAPARSQEARGGGCPPGLAKKDPPCIPPGQAKRRGYDIGDRLAEDVALDRYFDDLNLPRLDTDRYYRTDDTVYRVDPNTRAILDAIAIAEILLN